MKQEPKRNFSEYEIARRGQLVPIFPDKNGNMITTCEAVAIHEQGKVLYRPKSKPVGKPLLITCPRRLYNLWMRMDEERARRDEKYRLRERASDSRVWSYFNLAIDNSAPEGVNSYDAFGRLHANELKVQYYFTPFEPPKINGEEKRMSLEKKLHQKLLHHPQVRRPLNEEDYGSNPFIDLMNKD